MCNDRSGPSLYGYVKGNLVQSSFGKGCVKKSKLTFMGYKDFSNI